MNYESELCLCVIRTAFILPILLKKFLKQKQTEQKGDEHCPIETLVCNCWTNDYTLDQLVLNVSMFVTLITQTSLDLCTYIANFHSIPF
jgi:hypothetical protein